MADNESKGGSSEGRVEVSFAEDQGSISVEDGNVTSGAEGVIIDRNAQNEIEGDTQDDTTEVPGVEGTEGGDDVTGEEDQEGADEDDKGEPIELVDLDPFDPASEETVAAYNAEFKDETGNLKIDRFGLELDRNIQRDGKAELNAGTYDYLASLGIPRSLVDGQIAMRENATAYQKVQAEKDDLALFTIAGSPAALQAAKEWALKGGLTEAQRERHEQALKSTNKQDREDAVELLMTRYRAANPEEEALRDEPVRDATKGQGTPKAGAVKPFANREEWRQARKEAGDNIQKLREIDRRKRVSPF